MVQRDNIPEGVNDIELYKLIINALDDEGPTYGETPYGATKTAELDIQFSIDPSFGLSRERYGWYSDGVLFDKTNFDESGSRIDIETSGTDGTSTARIRSAYPGQYVSHTIAEPGFGAEIDSKNVEYDSNDRVSLTHGEISLEIGSLDDADEVGINAHGISFEEDGTYHQVRVDKNNVAFIPQEDWNIDPMDGTGPSGRILRPDDGYVYQFIYTWYGQGAMILAVQDPRVGQLLPLNQYVPDTPEKPALSSPNLPLQCLLENQGTADSLGLRLGGMQYAVHGKSQDTTTTRTTEEARYPPSGFISDNVALTNEAVDPFDTNLVPLIAARRNSDLEVQKGLRFEVDNVLLDADSPCYTFIFDEFDPAGAGLDGTFTQPRSRNDPIDDQESNILTNTNCTTYNPSDNAVLRGYSYIPSSKKDPALVTAGDSSSRVPLESTVVIAAALAPGANSATPQPILVPFREGF